MHYAPKKNRDILEKFSLKLLQRGKKGYGDKRLLSAIKNPL